MITEGLSTQLQNTINSLGYLGPELAVALGIVFLLLTDLVVKSARKTAVMVSLSVFFALGALSLIVPLWTNTPVSELFLGQLVVDKGALISKAVMLLALSFTLAFTSGFTLRSEYYYLLFFLVLGGMFMAGSTTFLSMYISLELTSVTGYILAVFGFKKLNYEAGIKYLLFGAFASGLMLYGISLLYGWSGSIDFTSAEFVSQLEQAPTSLLMVSLSLVLLGIFFKISLFPMHLWTPDVYQTAPVPVAAIFSIVPKLAGLMVLLRLSQALSGLPYFTGILLFFGTLSIVFGNLAAIGQRNVRRMLGYSSIAQSGFLVLPLALNDGFATTSFYFYIFIYFFMNYLAFYLVDHMEREQKFSFADYKGLGKENVLIGILFLISMVSLVGLPPLAGFTGKLYIFSALWYHWQTTSSDFVFYILLIAAVNTIIALFYYVKIPYFMFVKENDGVFVRLAKVNFAQRCIMCLFAILLIVFFVQPGSIIQVIQQATSQ